MNKPADATFASLIQARESFSANPSNESAARYLIQAATLRGKYVITEAEFALAAYRVAAWLAPRA